jgi:hypothetical protein
MKLIKGAIEIAIIVSIRLNINSILRRPYLAKLSLLLIH